MFKWRLKACRVQAGFTQKKAAKLLGVTESTLLSWENGRSSMKMEYAERMSELYGTPIEVMDFSKIGNAVIEEE